MSRHFLIDGYNLVKSVGAFADRSLPEGRAALIRWLTVDRPQGRGKNDVTVVFDGRSDVFFSHSHEEIEVIFTQDTSADDRIREMVEDHPRVKDVVVVSNDKDITIYARALGATIVSVEQFTVNLRQGQARSSKPPQAKGNTEIPAKHVSHALAEEINKEMRKRWIRDV